LRIPNFWDTRQRRPNFTVRAATAVNPHQAKGEKEMGKAIRAFALVLLLACSAQAGWMQADYAPPPPPPPSTQSVEEPAAEDQGATTETEAETPLLVQIALSLLTLL
jgi:hypothetical protein